MSCRVYTIITLKPSNQELRSVIEKALWNNFKNVQVNVRNGPDLTKPPFCMTSNGFGRNLTIAEVGGLGNLFPKLHKEKEYDIKEICASCNRKSAFVFGPGACPRSVMGVTGELVVDANLGSSKVASKVTIIEDERTSTYKTYTISSLKFNLMANLAISEAGGSAEVVHVKCSERIGQENFPECIRKGLAQHYGQSCVSLAGIFLLLCGRASVHIVPDFPPSPFKSLKQMKKWFHEFELTAPLVCASVIHSYDAGHHLRLEHTHCYSDHNDAGHYYNDTTPKSVVYEGWFAAAENIFRIDEI